MLKRIDSAFRGRAVRFLLGHRAGYLSAAKVIAVVARLEGVGVESLRRWVVQAEIDADDRDGQASEEVAEITRLKAENRRLCEDVAILKAVTIFSRGGTRSPGSLIMGFVDQMRAEGHAVGVDHPRPA